MLQNIYRRIFTKLVLVGLLFTPGLTHALNSGEQAPDFTVSDSQGKTQSLSKYKGKHIVLEWFNKDCPYVKKHYGSDNMQKLQREYTQKGAIWLTVLSSAPGKQGHETVEQVNATMKEKKGSPTAVLLDPEGKLGKLYGAKTTPHLFIVNPEGKLVYQGAIDDKATSDPEDIKTAKGYVRQALDQSMSGKPVDPASTVPYGCSVKY